MLGFSALSEYAISEIPASSSTTTVTRDIIAVIDTQTTVRLDKTPPVALLTTTVSDLSTPSSVDATAASTARDPIASGATVPAALRAVVDFQTVLKVDQVDQIEWQGILQVIVTQRSPIDFLSNLSVDSYPQIDWLISLKVDDLAAIEVNSSAFATQRQAIDHVTSLLRDVTSPIEWTGIVQVTVTDHNPIDWASAVQSHEIVPADTQSTARADQIAALERQSSLSVIIRAPIEWTRLSLLLALDPTGFVQSAYTTSSVLSSDTIDAVQSANLVEAV